MVTRIKKVSIYTTDRQNEDIEIKNEYNATLVDNVLNFVFSYNIYNKEVHDLIPKIFWLKHMIRDKKIKSIYIITDYDEWINLTSDGYLLEETENPLYFRMILDNNKD